MFSWIADNIGTIITALAVITVIAAVIAVMLRDKKQGHSSCGSNCSHCAMAGKCHQYEKK